MQQLQEFILAWTNWYYSNGKYPAELYDKMPWEMKLNAMNKTSQIKKIMGEPAE